MGCSWRKGYIYKHIILCRTLFIVMAVTFTKISLNKNLLGSFCTVMDIIFYYCLIFSTDLVHFCFSCFVHFI